jgi:hypothetical protein
MSAGFPHRIHPINGLLDLCSTPKLEDNFMKVICMCLFKIFTTTVHIWRLSPPAIWDMSCHRGKGHKGFGR